MKLIITIFVILITWLPTVHASPSSCALVSDQDVSLEDAILKLSHAGVPEQIVKNLLDSYRRSPERWNRIGYDLVEATELTARIEHNHVKIYDISVSLRMLSTTHDLTDSYDLERLQNRIVELKAHSLEILRVGKLTSESSRQIIPSESPFIRVAKDLEGHFYVFDGNGRTEALRAVFGNQHPDLKIEVRVYEITDENTINFMKYSQQHRRGTAFSSKF